MSDWKRLKIRELPTKGRGCGLAVGGGKKKTRDSDGAFQKGIRSQQKGSSPGKTKNRKKRGGEAKPVVRNKISRKKILSATRDHKKDKTKRNPVPGWGQGMRGRCKKALKWSGERQPVAGWRTEVMP